MDRKYLSLFSGIGGLDYGMEAAGFENIGCIEMDLHACENLKLNNDWPVYQTSVTAFDPKTILKTNKMKKGDLDLLVGGPPCQSYSKSSLWAGDIKRGYRDSRGKLIDEYMRFVAELLPKVFLIENVPGFISAKSKENGFQHVLRAIKDINKSSKAEYKLSAKIINCAEYGVPQKRERVFIVGSRLEKKFEFPESMYADPTSDEVIKEGKLPFITAGEALSFVKNTEDEESLAMSGKWKHLISKVPPGQNYIYFTEQGSSKKKLFDYRSRYWTFLLKLSPQSPSWTIQASPGSSTGPFHWENRKLSLKELAKLQTLPSFIKFHGSRRLNQKLIGNAVPSAIAEFLGVEIRKQLFKDQVRYSAKLSPCKQTIRNFKPMKNQSISSSN